MSFRSVRSGSQNDSLVHQPKRGGMTPMMVRGTSSSVMVRPMARGSPLKKRCQNP